MYLINTIKTAIFNSRSKTDLYKSKLCLKYFIIFHLTILIVCPINLSAQKLNLEYSTIIGGSGWDYGHAIGVDDSGYVYVAGQANSSDYPVTINAFDKTFNGSSDILLSKINRNGSALVYSTYIGGTGRDDTRKVYVDKTGCVYLTGSTESTDFPLTNNSLAGANNGYFLKVNSTGDSLLYSSRWIGGEKLLTDPNGNIVIVGTTTSYDFPTTENAFCRTLSGDQDIFVVKINPSNNEIIFSTLIGGMGNDWAPSMVIDSENNIVIAGRTNSEDFPLMGNAYGSYNQGKYNIIVTKLKSDGTELLYSTIIGGSDDDWAFDVAADRYNNVYITGVTKSNDFPVSHQAYDSTYNEADDAFLLKLNPDGSELVYSTYLGGSSKDGGRAVLADSIERAYITGCTRSTNFPVTDDAYDKTFNGAGTESWAWGDPFLLVMNPEGTQLEYSTYYGGSLDEEAYGIVMDNKGSVYLCGITSSTDFPTTEGAYNRTKNGSSNIYIAKFSFGSISAVKTGIALPAKTELMQNYPNPFNPSTTINYCLLENSNVKLVIYNTYGQEIETLVNSFQNAGDYSITWNAAETNNRLIPGVYFYLLVTEEDRIQKKMVLIK